MPVLGFIIRRKIGWHGNWIWDTNICRRKYKEAVLVFEQIIAIDNKCIKAYAGELEAYIAIGDRANMEKFYEKALSVVGSLDEKTVKTNMDYIAEIYMSACYVYGEGTQQAAEVMEEGFKLLMEARR